MFPTGDHLVMDWFDGQTHAVQANFLTRLEYLAQQPREGWIRPYFDLLSGDCKGLGEIRFKADRTQHRPLGFFGPKRMEFTFVEFAIEKDRKFIPRAACKKGLKRMEEILKERAKTNVCNF